MDFLENFINEDSINERSRLYETVGRLIEENKPLNFGICTDAVDLQCFDILEFCSRDNVKKAISYYFDSEIIDCNETLEYAILKDYYSAEEIEDRVFFRKEDKKYLYLFTEYGKCVYGMFYDKNIFFHYVDQCDSKLLIEKYLVYAEEYEKCIIKKLLENVEIKEILHLVRTRNIISTIIEDSDVTEIFKFSVENLIFIVMGYILEKYEIDMTQIISSKYKDKLQNCEKFMSFLRCNKIEFESIFYDCDYEFL